jgi:hypothetical protein
MGALNPDLGIVDMESLLAEAASAFSGEREFVYYIHEKPVIFTYTLKPDSSLFLGVRQKAQDLLKLTPPPAWKPVWPEGGMTADIATRMAWGIITGVGFKGGAKLGEMGLLKLQKQAGPLFVLLTEDISVSATGIMRSAEAEVIEDLGEDSPPTTSD